TVPAIVFAYGPTKILEQLSGWYGRSTPSLRGGSHPMLDWTARGLVLGSMLAAALGVFLSKAEPSPDPARRPFMEVVQSEVRRSRPSLRGDEPVTREMRDAYIARLFSYNDLLLYGGIGIALLGLVFATALPVTKPASPVNVPQTVGALAVFFSAIG